MKISAALANRIGAWKCHSLVW